MTRFLDLDEAEWDRVMNINLKGVFLTCRAVLPGMVERKRGGHVINIRSVLNKLGEPNFSHYAASKFGVLGLTQSIAKVMAQYDIIAKTIRPGGNRVYATLGRAFPTSRCDPGRRNHVSSGPRPVVSIVLRAGEDPGADDINVGCVELAAERHS
jgi:NAD(P)-dependent dehydrogenase (short-subunit alcohol dehydrogenase family)